MTYRGHSGAVRVESGDYYANFYLRPNSDDDVVVDEVWFENVYRINPEDVAGKAVLDIGGNIGAFSALALAYGCSAVHVYEPVPSNFERLADHLMNYSLRATLHEAAVSGSRGTIGFRINAEGHTGGGMVDDDGDIIVQAVSFKDALRELDEIGVLKMDIEGGEYECFESIESSDLKHVERITMEFHATDPGRFGLMIEKIAEWGHVEILGRPSLGGQVYGLRY